MEPDVCPQCGAKLEPGYLLGKQSRIRWSGSANGITVFHGTPLMRIRKGQWRNWRSWINAPNIPARRCPACHLVVFAYDNDAPERPAREASAALILAIVLFGCAAALVGIALWDWTPQPPVPFALRLGLIAISLFLGGFGALALAHVLKSRRARPTDR
jgi:hypothetical protein